MCPVILRSDHAKAKVMKELSDTSKDFCESVVKIEHFVVLRASYNALNFSLLVRLFYLKKVHLSGNYNNMNIFGHSNIFILKFFVFFEQK